MHNSQFLNTIEFKNLTADEQLSVGHIIEFWKRVGARGRFSRSTNWLWNWSIGLHIFVKKVFLRRVLLKISTEPHNWIVIEIYKI